MGMILWTVGIIALALKINANEAKAHEPPRTPPPVVAQDTTVRQDTIKLSR